MMLDKILKAVEKYHMLSPGGAVAAGVSGGADSVALLHILLSLKKKFALTVAAAHLNHNLRGAESLRDERFVKDLCAHLSVPLFTESADVAKISKKKGISLEEAGREARYAFFARLGKEQNAKIAVAHNANDSVETALFHFARGSALRGLCGIPPVRGNIIRPLIFCERAEIERYLSENGLSFITDSTNESLDFTRNRIRHEVLPRLLRVNPGLTATVTANLEALRADADYLDLAAEKALIAIKREDGCFSRAKYLETEKCLRLRVLLRVLSEKGARADNKRLTRLDGLVGKGGGAEQISAELTFFADAESFCARPHEAAKEAPVFPVYTLTGAEQGKTFVYSDKKLTLLNTDYEYYEENIKSNGNPLKNVIDCDKISGTVIIRQRRPGDAIKPLGRGCTKTLKNLCQEAGIPPDERGGLLVLADSFGLVWAEGFGAAERVRVFKETKRALTITAENKNNILRCGGMKRDIKEILITEDALADKVKELGKRIGEDYRDKNLLMISVLKGAVVFMADLMRAVEIPARIDFMSVSSYGSGEKTSGVVKIVKDLDIPLEGYDVLIVEDILDSGMTLAYLKEILLKRGPKSVRVVTLMDKPDRRKVPIDADYTGFTIPDQFAVGYGLDYNEKYRNLPFVGALDPAVYTHPAPEKAL